MTSFIKHSKSLWHLGMLSLALGIFFGVAHIAEYRVEAQANNETLVGYAWGASNNTGATNDEGSGYGWISFSNASAGYGVVLSGQNLVGKAWSPYTGFIQFGNLSGFPRTGAQYCGNDNNCNAHFEGDNLYGWARMLSHNGDGWDGWIALRGPGYGVKKVTHEGRVVLQGLAWGSSKDSGDAAIGNGPGWIKFFGPQDGNSPGGNGGGCSGVCIGGTQNPVYSCAGTESGQNILWQATVTNPPSGITYGYSFNGARPRVTPTFTTPSSERSMTVDFIGSDGSEPDASCSVNNPDTPRTTEIELFLKRNENSQGVPELTVSVDDSFILEFNIGEYLPASCTLNGAVISQTNLTNPIQIEEIALVSKNYTLSCRQVDLNNDQPLSETVRLRVTGDGVFNEQ